MFKKIFGTFTSKLLTAVVNFLIVWLTAKYLGTSGKGTTSLIVANITFIQLLNNFVGGSALVYLAPRYKSSILLVPSYIWAVLSCSIGTLALNFLGKIEPNLVIHTFFLSLIFAIFSVHQMILMGKEKIGWFNTLAFLQVFITLGVIVFYFFGAKLPEVNSFVKAIYIAYSAVLILGLIPIFKLVERGFNWQEMMNSLKNILNYVFVAQIASIIAFLNNRLSYYLLEEWNGISSVGIYSTGVSVVEATGTMISKSIAMVQYSRVANETDEQKSIRLTNSLTKLSFWCGFIVLAVIILIPQQIYIWIFGEGFKDISYVTYSLAPGILSLAFSTTFLHYFSGIGNYKLVNIATGIGLIFTITFAFILIPIYGIIGAGITTSIAHTAQSVYLYFKYCQVSDFRIQHLIKLKEEKNLLKNYLKEFREN